MTDSLKLRFTFFLLIGIVLFSSLFNQVGYTYNALLAYRNLLQPLVQQMQKLPGNSVYFFSDSGEFAFPAVDYTHQVYTSRFGCLTWVPLFKNINDTDEYQLNYLRNQQEMNLYIADIYDDINRFKPDLIFVDKRGKGYIGIIQPDYIKFFSNKAEFKKAWSGYTFLTTLDGKPLYKFDVYQKIKHL